ncbi:tRNA lysidine(34) synthetase TilS [Candidatus Peregrinibacteria bacterium]|nr:tRNA lysidine(34) synthetase TilS [Candidatus Peregrinibacteria bacterium]
MTAMKGFNVINEGFACENCGEANPKSEGTCRNHCRKCLYSMHVDDKFPGDRASKCNSLMMPVSAHQDGKKGWMIIHKCLKCEEEATKLTQQSAFFIGSFNFKTKHFKRMNNQEAKKLEQLVLNKLKTLMDKPDESLIFGFSGGPDSTFLINILAKTALKIHAAHVNHMLRGKESLLDEKFIKTAAKKLKIQSDIKRENIKATSQKLSIGTEEAGRKIRYEYFHKLAKKYNAKAILTAHHADDNLETILFNLIRGANLKGLCGIKEKETFFLDKKITLIRPLLSIPKDKITAYLKFKKTPFRKDKSNVNTDYSRNFLRHKIIPLLKKLNPNLTETVSKNTENLKEIDNALTNESQNWIKKNITKQKFDAKKFRSLSIPTQKTIIMQIHKNTIGNTQNLKTSNLEEVLSIINKNLGNKEKKLGNITFSIKNNKIKWQVRGEATGRARRK